MQGALSRLQSRTAAVLAVAVVLGLVLAGCVDDGEVVPSPTALVPPPTSTAEGGSALPLERFHYVASLRLRDENSDAEASEIVVATEGDFQSPDRHAFTYTTRRGDDMIDQSVVIIGDKAWFRQGDAPWRETTIADPEIADLLAGAFSAVRPRFLGGSEFEKVRESVRRLPSMEESVNGVAANHYRVGSEGSEFFGALSANAQLLQNVRDLSWDLWLAEDGAWPVRLLASATVTASLEALDKLDLRPPIFWELRIDVSRPNDPTLAVVAPERSD